MCSPCQSDPWRAASRILPRAHLCVTEFLRTTTRSRRASRPLPGVRGGGRLREHGPKKKPRALRFVRS
jgi:hypothetical protein